MQEQHKWHTPFFPFFLFFPMNWAFDVQEEPVLKDIPRRLLEIVPIYDKCKIVQI